MPAQLLGGIGLFLLGMLLLTDGLKAAAGDALKRILVRFTGTPLAAFFAGLTLTALVQSSSATTLATIGFVSAGLLTFAQAIGIVIGSSVGTTTTGWLVSLLGLKLSVGALALPIIGVGALMRLVLRGRAASIGFAVAGFGLIFVGIDTLQNGMAGLAERVRPESLPQATLLGRLLLALIGVLFTVVMQSSSAAIATTITAFHAGTVNFDQALSLVIGASIGTTVTAALASIGASAPARRTALAHILFNSFAGAIGFLAAPLFAFAVRRLDTGGDLATGALCLAVFHTSFNLLGAAMVLPSVGRLAGLVTRLIPDRGPALTRHLDNSLLEVPEVAIEAVRRSLLDCASELVVDFQALVTGNRRAPGSLPFIQNALRDTRLFLGRVPASLAPAEQVNPRLAVVHALDHLEQLTAEVLKFASQKESHGDARLEPARAALASALETAASLLSGSEERASLKALESQAAEVAALRRTGREAILEETAHGALSPERADSLLTAVRSMDSAAYHTWPLTHYLSGLDAHGRTTEPNMTRPPD